MQRIDGPTRAAALPAPAATGTGASAPGYFHDGDPLTSTPPTTVTSDWANMIQEELMSVLGAASIAPDKTNHAQLLAAILALCGGAGDLGAGWVRLPIGLIMQWGVLPIGSGTNLVHTTLTFPIVFPAGVFIVVGNGDGPANPGWDPMVVGFAALSATGATCTVDTANAGQNVAAGNHVRWLALGH